MSIQLLVVNMDCEFIFFQIDWQSRFVKPSQSTYPLPPYVNKFMAGITRAKVDWRITRGLFYFMNI